MVVVIPKKSGSFSKKRFWAVLLAVLIAVIAIAYKFNSKKTPPATQTNGTGTSNGIPTDPAHK